MYAALGAESERALDASLLHENDVRSSDSLDEQLRSPSDFRDQRVCFDQKLMHVVPAIRQALVLAKQNVLTRDGVSADIRFTRIRLSIDGFVERELVASVGRQVELRRKRPRFLEGRSPGGVDVGSRQGQRNWVRSRRASTSAGNQNHRDGNQEVAQRHVFHYEPGISKFHTAYDQLLARGKLEHVTHSEDAAFADEPVRRFQRALSEDTAISCLVPKQQLLETSVENDLVRSGHRAGSYARSRYGSLERIACCLGDGDRGSRRSVFLFGVVRFDDVRIKILERPHQSAGVTCELDQHVDSE